jgi:DNA-binding transcriptional ArsR family regulator
MVKRSSEHLDLVFSALSDPTRRAMLEKLAHGASSVTELAEPHDMSLPAISKHLKILETAGFITRELDGRVHRITLESKPMKEAFAWLELYRKFWEAKFDALEKYLAKPHKKEK